MKKIFCFSVLISVLFGCFNFAIAEVEQSANASFKILPGLNNFSIDLDTKSGHASSFETRIPCEANVISTRAQVLRIGKDKKWGAVSTISLTDDNAEARLSIQLIKSGSDKNLAIAKLQLAGEESKKYSLEVIKEVGEEWHLDIGWDSIGNFAIAVDGNLSQFEFPLKPTKLNVSNSTGETIFDELVLGYIEGVLNECQVS